MPTYEYECCECRVRFERRQRITDEPVSVCPECGGETRRVFHPVGIIFKGSGFYCTDNRSSGGSGRSESASKADESTGEKKEDKAGEKPVEKAPAEKAESKSSAQSSTQSSAQTSAQTSKKAMATVGDGR